MGFDPVHLITYLNPPVHLTTNELAPFLVLLCSTKYKDCGGMGALGQN